MITCCTASTISADDLHHTFDQRKTDTFCMLLLLLMYCIIILENLNGSIKC